MMDLLLLISLQVIFFAIGVLACNKGGDCLEGYTCIGNICTKCLSCSFLFRKGKSCVVDFNECEDCLEGYEEISVTDFSTAIKPCKPVKKKVKIKECTDSSSSCPPNNYCSEESCVKCFDCAVMNRLPPVYKCAKGLNECGSCMNGFYEIAITTDTNSRKCEPTTLAVYETPPPLDVSLGIYTSVIILFLVFGMLFTALLTARIRKSKKLRKTLSRLEILPSAPPLPFLDSPQSAERQRHNSFVTKYKGLEPSVARFENELTQQAKVFKLPNALYYLKGDEGDHDLTAGDDRSLRNNSRNLDRSCAVANRVETSDFSDPISPRRFTGVSAGDTTDFAVQQSNDNNVGGNRSTSSDVNTFGDIGRAP